MATIVIATKTTPPKNQRFWEIDILRGMAVLLMVYFHLMWDLQFFNLSDINVFLPPWQQFARGIGTTFLVLMGLSLTFSVNHSVANGIPPIKKHVIRTIRILLAATAVTIFTYFTIGESYVRFGILHLIGVAMILAYPFLRFHALVNIIVAMALLLLWYVLGSLYEIRVSSEWFLPFGLAPLGISMVDYYPLIPWFGAVLLGIAAGKWFYPSGQRRIPIPDFGEHRVLRIFGRLGRHSLAIYLLHQPILIGLLVMYIYLSTRVSTVGRFM